MGLECAPFICYRNASLAELLGSALQSLLLSLFYFISVIKSLLGQIISTVKLSGDLPRMQGTEVRFVSMEVHICISMRNYLLYYRSFKG